jgi:hypothetical protein
MTGEREDDPASRYRQWEKTLFEPSRTDELARRAWNLRQKGFSYSIIGKRIERTRARAEQLVHRHERTLRQEQRWWLREPMPKLIDPAPQDRA